MVRQLEENGKGFAPGSQKKVLLSSNFSTDGFVVEAPWMIYKDPHYFLFFSANGFCDPRYHVGVAKSLNVTGPYIRSDRNVIELDESRYKDEDVSFVSPGQSNTDIKSLHSKFKITIYNGQSFFLRSLLSGFNSKWGFMVSLSCLALW